MLILMLSATLVKWRSKWHMMLVLRAVLKSRCKSCERVKIGLTSSLQATKRSVCMPHLLKTDTLGFSNYHLDGGLIAF